MPCGQNLAYILENDSDFLPTEYKVLQSCSGGCLMKCMRMTWNGKTQILYLTENYKPVSETLPLLMPENFQTIASGIFSALSDVKENGFLSCTNLDISPGHIFTDPQTYKVKMIYVPAKKGFFSDEASAEGEARSMLIRQMQEYANLNSPATAQLRTKLADGGMRFTGPGTAPVRALKNEVPGKRSFPEPAGLRLAALNAPESFEIRVDRTPFIIGKKPELADGVILYNKMVSRTHCRIDKTQEGYTAADLNSANGTFINQRRIAGDCPVPIRNGDILRLADSDFRVITD